MQYVFFVGFMVFAAGFMLAMEGHEVIARMSRTAKAGFAAMWIPVLVGFWFLCGELARS